MCWEYGRCIETQSNGKLVAKDLSFFIQGKNDGWDNIVEK